jgi:hypothetical protein
MYKSSSSSGVEARRVVISKVGREIDSKKRKSREVEKPKEPPMILVARKIFVLVYVGRSVEEFSMMTDLDHIPRRN